MLGRVWALGPPSSSGLGPLSMAADGTLYDRLGVLPTATISEIRIAFREKARLLHPDVSGASSAEMAAVNEAWAILSDRARRANYDAELRAETIGNGDPSAVGRDDVAGGDSVATRMGLLVVITVLSLLFLLTMLFVYAFSRSGTGMTG